MLNVFWTGAALLFAYVLVMWRSPLVLVVPGVVLASMMAPFTTGDAVLLNLIMIGWSITLVSVAIYMRSRGMSLDRITEISANYHELTARKVGVLIFAIIVLVATFAFWVKQGGITDISSAKRIYDAGPYYHLLNTVIGVYSLHAIVALAFLRFRWTNPHILMAVISFVFLMMVGYLSSSRSTVVIPMMAIGLIYMARMSSIKARLRVVLGAAIFAPLLVLFMALVSAERAGYSEIGTGLEILSEQVTRGEGYGFSPGKDRVMWEYSEHQSIQEMRTVLFGGFYGPIPRALWEGKPDFVGSGPLVGAHVFRGHYWVDRGGGTPVSFPAELALAFGSWWFLVGLVGAGLIMIMVAELTRFFPLMLVPALFFYSGLIGAGLPKSQTSFLIEVVSMLILSYVFGVRLVYRGARLA